MNRLIFDGIFCQITGFRIFWWIYNFLIMVLMVTGSQRQKTADWAETKRNLDSFLSNWVLNWLWNNKPSQWKLMQNTARFFLFCILIWTYLDFWSVKNDSNFDSVLHLQFTFKMCFHQTGWVSRMICQLIISTPGFTSRLI